MSTSVDWLFVGTPNFGAHFHVSQTDKEIREILNWNFQVDDVGDPSWQAQLKGSKLWVIRPPPECLYQCGMDRIEVVVNPGETCKFQSLAFLT